MNECLRGNDNGAGKHPRIIVADRFFTRLRGLLFRKPLAAGEGLILVPCSSIHTFGMGYSIDVVFLDPDCRVVRLVHALPPRRIRSAPGAKMVLELAAGEAKTMREGDTLYWLKGLLEDR